MPTIRKISEKQEERLAKVFKGRRAPASGAKWYCKSDVSCADFRIEAKFTEAGKFKFSMGVWNKIKREAIETCKTPLLCVMLRGDGIGVKRNYVIFDRNDFCDTLCLSVPNAYSIGKVVTMDVDFIINNTPFSMSSKDTTFIMMKERDFLDELGLV